MNIVGSDQFHLVYFCQFNQFGVHADLFLKNVSAQFRICCGVSLQFEIIVFPKDGFVPEDGFIRCRKVSLHDQLRDLPSQTSGRNDQSFTVFFQQILVDSGFVVHPLGIGNGHEFQEVAVTFHVFCKEDQVVAGSVLLLILVFVLDSPGGHIGLYAQNGFDVVFLAGFVKILHPEHVAVVSQGQGTHAIRFGF